MYSHTEPHLCETILNRVDVRKWERARMKNILSISDSIDNTRFDVKYSIATIKSYGMEPFVVVPEFTDEEGVSQGTDVLESLEFCFSEMKPDSISIGYIRSAEAIGNIAHFLTGKDTGPVIAAPSLISDKGELMVGEDTYNAILSRLLPVCQFIILNAYEAELLAEFEIRMEKDFLRAAKKIFNTYNCLSVIRCGEKAGNKDFLFVGNTYLWIEDFKDSVMKRDVSFIDAISCELAADNSIFDAVQLALKKCSADKEQTQEQEAAEESEPEPEPEPEPVPEPLPEPVAESVIEPENSEAAPADSETETETDAQLKQIKPTPAMISPAKNLREIARHIEGETNPMPKITIKGVTTPPPAVTSAIEPQGNKGTVSEIKAHEARSVGESLSELQKMKDKLKKMSEL